MGFATEVGAVVTATVKEAAAPPDLQAQFTLQPGFFQSASGVLPLAPQFLLLSVDEHSTVFQS